MTTTIVIACPKCKKQSKGSPDLAGKKIRCKHCEHLFVVVAPGAVKAGAAKARPPRPDDDLRADTNPYAVTDHDLARRCPHCATDMEPDAIICLGCGYNTQTREHMTVEKTYANTAGDWFLWLLPGILCVFTVLALIAFDVVYVIVLRDWLKERAKETWYWTAIEHPSAKVWVVIVTLFIMFLAGRFAVKRLILHPVPPERRMRG